MKYLLSVADRGGGGAVYNFLKGARPVSGVTCTLPTVYINPSWHFRGYL